MPSNFGIPRNFRQRSWPRMLEYNRFFQVANKIPDAVLYGPPGPDGRRAERWLDGISFDPITLDPPDCFADPGCAGDDEWTTGAVTDDNDPTTFLPVELRTRLSCSTIGLDDQELTARLKAQFAAWEEPTFAGKFLIGDDEGCWDNIGNPTVGPGATPILDSSIAIDEAVARLEDAIAFRFGAALGTIFMSPGMLTMLHNRGGLVFENGRWYTPTGTSIILVDADADSPDLGEGEDALSPGFDGDFSWVYGCGPVWAHQGPIDITPTVFSDFDGGDPRVLPRNVTTFWVRRSSIALFDPLYRYRIAAGYSSSVFVS